MMSGTGCAAPWPHLHNALSNAPPPILPMQSCPTTPMTSGTGCAARWPLLTATTAGCSTPCTTTSRYGGRLPREPTVCANVMPRVVCVVSGVRLLLHLLLSHQAPCVLLSCCRTRTCATTCSPRCRTTTPRCVLSARLSVSLTGGQVCCCCVAHVAGLFACAAVFATRPVPGAQGCTTLAAYCQAQEATEALKPILGEWYKRDDRPILKACWQDWSLCR